MATATSCLDCDGDTWLVKNENDVEILDGQLQVIKTRLANDIGRDLLPPTTTVRRPSSCTCIRRSSAGVH